MAVCWQYTDGRTEQLSDDEVVERFWCLKDEIKELKELNARLAAENEQLQADNGKVTKALRKSAFALRTSGETIRKLGEAPEEDDDDAPMMGEILNDCKPYPSLYHRAQELVDMVRGNPESIIAEGARMELNLLHGQAMQKHKWNEDMGKEVVARHGNWV
jgi:hypothetical protein